MSRRNDGERRISRSEFLHAGGLSAAALMLGSGEALARSRRSALGLERAHAHNDYEHERPLLDALSYGFKSVEADVWLVGEELLVAHDLNEVKPGRNLQSLYLEPLREIVERNRGSVYRRDPDYLTLLVDIKSEPVSTYLELDEALRSYRRMLTTFEAGGVADGAVTVIVSGNRPRLVMEQQSVRHAAYDGRLSDLGVTTDQAFMPLISDNWTNNFTWMGDGPMSSGEREKLRSIVSTAHSNGQRVRFWETPDRAPQREAVWRELLAARVDHINTDHLAALEKFLLRNDPRSEEPYVSWLR